MTKTHSALRILGTVAALLASHAAGHTWVEQMRVISDNGSFTGDFGYPRGYVGRTDPGFNGFSDNYLVPQTGIRIMANTSLCHPAQRTSNYTNPAYPKLKVAPGDFVAMQYLENGHTTLPENQKGKPKDGGTVFVYGTTTPSNDEKLADVLAWTKDGSGGNKKGFLMTAQSFDDGLCHQINCGNISISRQQMYPVHIPDQPTSSLERWCETDVQIPSSVKPGQLTVYWVWQWPTEPGIDCFAPDGKDEYYTTCSDLTITDKNSTLSNKVLAAPPDQHTLVQQNPQSVANPNWQARTALTQTPDIIMVEGTKTIGLKIAAASASGFMAACQASQKAAAGQPPTPKAPEQPCAPVPQFSTNQPPPPQATPRPTSNAQPSVPQPNPSGPTTQVVTITQMVTITTVVPTPANPTQPSSAGTTTLAGSSQIDLAIPTLSVIGTAPPATDSTGPVQLQVPVNGGGSVVEKVERRHARHIRVGN